MDSVFIGLSFSAFTIVLIFLREIFLWLRSKIPKTVQCWFCHSKTQVEYSVSNSWFCSNCDQYNGFTKDGDYNRIVDNQYEEKLNFSISSIGRSKDAWKSVSQLCENCNHNQELKVRQLAAFVPLNEKNYDTEVEHYRAQLEKCYKLCSNCEVLISKIFSNERNYFSIPRRLATSLKIMPEVTGFARVILYINLLVSLIISMSAYIKLEGIPPVIAVYLKEYNKIVVPLWLLKPEYHLAFGLVLNVIGCVKIKSSGLLLNTFSWLIVLILTLFPKGYKNYVIALQAISGIISCGVSIICLNSNQRKLKKRSKNIFEAKKCNSNNYNSEPLNFEPTYEEHFVQKNKSFRKSSPPSPAKTPPLTSANIIRPQRNWSESINNGIRGLNLGNNGGQGGNFTQRRADGIGGDAWWVNGQKQRRQPAQRSTPVSSNNVRPPSTSSSGFSDMVEEMDDCTSCTGHSPVCRHICHLTPSPTQYTCYYAAAYFQRLLYSSTPPSASNISLNTKTPQRSVSDPYSYIYTMPMIALIASNVALLWTIYTQQTIKE